MAGKFSTLKVCHLSTYRGGGAGTAAWRVHSSLLEEGIDSHFLCASSNKKGRNLAIASARQPTFLTKALRKARLATDRVDTEKQHVKNCGGQYEIFTTPASHYRLEQHPLVQQADIIHLHWIAGFVDYPSFFTDVGKPIVWTLHDMNPFMGGFHYRGDRDRNKDNTALLAIDDRYAAIKQRALAAHGKISIVTPSRWLYNESTASSVTGSFEHYHIPYGLDTNIFRRYPQKTGREVFDLPLGKKVILFVSENVQNIRKNFPALLDALQSIQNTEEYILVAVGDVDPDYANQVPNLYVTGSIEDERLLALLYAAADLFVIPSSEDNFPNVVLESLACSTPVIGFAIGGLTDVVVDNVNGLLAPELSSQALSRAIKAFFAAPPLDRNKIEQDCKAQFNLHQQAVKYRALYERALL